VAEHANEAVQVDVANSPAKRSDQPDKAQYDPAAEEERNDYHELVEDFLFDSFVFVVLCAVAVNRVFVSGCF